MQTEDAGAFRPPPLSFGKTFKKTNKKKRKLFSKRRDGRRGREGRKERGGGKKERGPLRTGTVIVHVDVNISTKTGSGEILQQPLRARSGALGNYRGLLISPGREKKSPAPNLLFFFFS